MRDDRHWCRLVEALATVVTHRLPNRRCLGGLIATTWRANQCPEAPIAQLHRHRFVPTAAGTMKHILTVRVGWNTDITGRVAPVASEIIAECSQNPTANMCIAHAVTADMKQSSTAT